MGRYTRHEELENQTYSLDFLVSPAETLDGVPVVGSVDAAADDPPRRARWVALAVGCAALVVGAAAVNASRAAPSHPASVPSATGSTAPVVDPGFDGTVLGAPFLGPDFDAAVTSAPVVDPSVRQQQFIADYVDASQVAAVTVGPITNPLYRNALGFPGDVGGVVSGKPLTAGKEYRFQEVFAYGGDGDHGPMVLTVSSEGGMLACPGNFIVRPHRSYTLACTLLPRAGTGSITLSVSDADGPASSSSVPFVARRS